MLVELDVIDHVILDEENKNMILLIFDVEDFWTIEKAHGFFNKLMYNKKRNEKNLEHLLYLKKKTENYVRYINNNGIIHSFPHCENSTLFSYEIRVVTNFSPGIDYLDMIKQMNKVMAKEGMNIRITNEISNK